MKSFEFLNQKNTREKKPGLSDKQYQLFENLGAYFTCIVQHYDLNVIEARKMDSGTLSAVIDVTTPSHRFVIKISARKDLESEAFFLENAELHGVDAPKIFKADFSKKIIPFEYMFLEFVEGALPKQLSESVRRKAGNILGKNLAAVHEIRCDGVGSIHENFYAFRSPQWQKLLISSLHKRWKEIASKEHVFTKDHQKRMEKILASRVLQQFQPRLLHGDVGGNNYLTQLPAQRMNPNDVLTHEREKDIQRVFFIDPGTWVGGDPMQDLAFSQISWNYHGFSEGVMEGYRHAHPLSAGEEERFRILRVFNQYWGALISRQRDRERWAGMFSEYEKLIQHDRVL